MEYIFFLLTGEYQDDKNSFILKYTPCFLKQLIDWHELLTECETIGKFKKLWCLEILSSHFILGLLKKTHRLQIFL